MAKGLPLGLNFAGEEVAKRPCVLNECGKLQARINTDLKTELPLVRDPEAWRIRHL